MYKFSVGPEDFRENEDIQVKYYENPHRRGCLFLKLKGQVGWVKVEFLEVFGGLSPMIIIPDVDYDVGVFKELIESVTHNFEGQMYRVWSGEFTSYSCIGRIVGINLFNFIELAQFYGPLNCETFYNWSITVAVVDESEVAEGSIDLPYSHFWFKFVSNYLSGNIFNILQKSVDKRRGGWDADVIVDITPAAAGVLGRYMEISGKKLTKCIRDYGHYYDVVVWHDYFGKGSVDFTYVNLISP